MLRCSECSEVCYRGRSKFSVGPTDVEPVTDTAIDLFGKDCDDLQEDIAIANGAITGTLKYVTGYTGFSSKTSEQSGNYIALKVTNATADEIYVGLSPSASGKELNKLDPDGMIVLQVTNKDEQVVRVETVTAGIHDGFSLDLSEVVCEEANG